MDDSSKGRQIGDKMEVGTKIIHEISLNNYHDKTSTYLTQQNQQMKFYFLRLIFFLKKRLSNEILL